MRTLDWIVFVAFLGYVVFDGIRRARGTKDLDGYYAGGRSIPWWAAGLSIMATQASAITVIGTTGKGHEGGMAFLHTYIGLPVAMVILCVFFVPLLRGAPILTAYEYLETRFGPVTRAIASLVFLVSRCAALGFVLYAPSVVLAAMTGLDESVTILIIGVLTTGYTVIGGVHAVVWTDVKQMIVILVGLAVALVILLVRVLGEFSLDEALTLAGQAGKLDALEVVPDSTDLVPKPHPPKGVEADTTSFWTENYNLWTGLFGGTFLMLAYFGCDQSQVQRILTNPSANDSRKALLISGFAKLPMQVVVLFIGVLLWLFHAIFGGPMWYSEGQAAKADPAKWAVVERDFRVAEANRLEKMREFVTASRESAGEASALEAYRESVRAVNATRAKARALLPKKKDYDDTNYIFPHFVLNELPILMVGLLVAAIFAAAMSSADSVLNSLSAATVVDFYKRWLRPNASDESALLAGRVATFGWGVFATLVALFVAGEGAIIEQINKIGSFFYGTLLGGFVLAMLVRRAGEVAAVSGLVAGMGSVLCVHYTLKVAFLWYNLIGCVAVVAVGWLVSLRFPNGR